MYFTKVQYWGHSHIITLPKNLRMLCGIKKGDWLFMSVEGGEEIKMHKVDITTRKMEIPKGGKDE